MASAETTYSVQSSLFNGLYGSFNDEFPVDDRDHDECPKEAGFINFNVSTFERAGVGFDETLKAVRSVGTTTIRLVMSNLPNMVKII